MNTSIHSGTALITGASSGIGSVYADRLARRGHDLVLVARDRDHLCALAAGITDHTGRSIEVLAADVGTRDGLCSVEQVLSHDASITMLVNNAGSGATAPMRLACAAGLAFAMRGHGTIINIASIEAIPRDPFNGLDGAAGAFVLAVSQSLHRDLTAKGVRVQAVVLDAPAIAVWNTPIERLPNRLVRSVAAMVDAALTGLDRGEVVTMASRPDVAPWGACRTARPAMRWALSRSKPAGR
jgi:short-subunit dehydrogenase